MNNFKYIDIHSHLNLSPLKEDQEAVILRMKGETKLFYDIPAYPNGSFIKIDWF